MCINGCFKCCESPPVTRYWNSRTEKKDPSKAPSLKPNQAACTVDTGDRGLVDANHTPSPRPSSPGTALLVTFATHRVLAAEFSSDTHTPLEPGRQDVTVTSGGRALKTNIKQKKAKYRAEHSQHPACPPQVLRAGVGGAPVWTRVSRGCSGLAQASEHSERGGHGILGQQNRSRTVSLCGKVLMQVCLGPDAPEQTAPDPCPRAESHCFPYYSVSPVRIPANLPLTGVVIPQHSLILPRGRSSCLVSSWRAPQLLRHRPPALRYAHVRSGPGWGNVAWEGPNSHPADPARLGVGLEWQAAVGTDLSVLMFYPALTCTWHGRFNSTQGWSSVGGLGPPRRP